MSLPLSGAILGRFTGSSGFVGEGIMGKRLIRSKMCCTRLSAIRIPGGIL